ncbi:MAG: SHOCT domain-containing protein [Desulfobacterales bacterium]|nr:SHOCT domain-containing protein [Desulfobacterales bacterium]
MISRRLTVFAAGLTAAFVILSDSIALAQQGSYNGWHMGPGMMGGYGMMGWFGGIFTLVVWILIIVGLVLLIKWLVQSTRSEPGGLSGTGVATSRALEILRERYARGEIDKAEFEEKKKDLSS